MRLRILSVNVRTIVKVFLGGVANSSNDVEKCQQAFLAPLPGMDSISMLGSDAKKCQQQVVGNA
jgi:hypothetical protein